MHTTESALAHFDSLPAVALHEMTGSWRGEGVHTGHLLDGVLEETGWRGKTFHTTEDVDPLVFERDGRGFRVNPALLPLGLALRFPRLIGNPQARRSARALLPLLRTRRPRARLRMVEYRSVATASMVYDDLPIIDHFRRVDADTLLGAMDLRDSPAPFFFRLSRSAT